MNCCMAVFPIIIAYNVTEGAPWSYKLYTRYGGGPMDGIVCSRWQVPKSYKAETKVLIYTV